MPRRATKRGDERTPLDRDCDVLICGASFAGLAVARELAGSGADVLIVDRYEIGERQTSACGIPTRWLEELDLMGSERQRFDNLVIHTPHGDSRFPLPWTFSTFDYRELCKLLFEGCDARFETAKVESRDGTRVVTASRDGAAQVWDSPAAMSFVFSYGGAMVKDNKAAFASPEAIEAVAMYGQMLSQAGPVGVGRYEWYDVLNDFAQGGTAMAIDSSVLATDISNPARSRVAKQAGFAAFPHVGGRAAVPFMSHWQACINAKSSNKRAAFLFLLWATSKPTSLQTAAAGLATTRMSAWSSEGFKKGFGAQAAAAALTNLQNADVERAINRLDEFGFFDTAVAAADLPAAETYRRNVNAGLAEFAIFHFSRLLGLR